MAEPRAQNALGHLQSISKALYIRLGYILFNSFEKFDKELNRDVAIKVIDLEEAVSRPIQKEWMNELDRLGDVYKQGVAYFIQFAIVNNRGLTTCPCPCRECRNGKSFVFDTISRHLIRYGMDKNYRVWVLHGENPCTDPVVEPVIEEENTEAEGLGMGNFVDASYGVHEVVACDLNEDEENHMGILNHHRS
ncbi:hypothetical protein IFM89_036675 [Coptis chinensis]|uniref:Transposase-associated domain-containing protein n=1 Tax=Coptis chinensis TaxID=261450 RepID=A0A835I8Y0_9MAGN|nr:hypothetical protein IFM89_036675 [Coptis chinensis]